MKQLKKRQEERKMVIVGERKYREVAKKKKQKGEAALTGKVRIEKEIGKQEAMEEEEADRTGKMRRRRRLS